MSKENLQNARTQTEHQLRQENISNTNIQQHLSNVQETTSQQKELLQGSDAFVQNRQNQTMNLTENFSNQISKYQESLQYSEISGLNFSDQEDQNYEKSQLNQVEIIKEEEQNNYSDGEQDLLVIPPSFQSIKKPLSYDELNRKCLNLENDLKSTQQKYEIIIKQTINQQEKITDLEEQERKSILAIDQKIQEIHALQINNQKSESQLLQLQKKNLDQEQCISQFLEKINLIQIQLIEQTQQINSLKSQLQEKTLQYQQKLQNKQYQYDMNLKLQMKKFMESKTYLKLNEKLKIKDQIINYLENELADLKISILKSKQESNNKIKSQTSQNEQKILNNLINDNYQSQLILQTHDKLLPKAQTPKKQSQPFQDGQRINQSQVSEKQKFTWIAQLNEKNQKILKSIASSLGTNQSHSNLNCSLTESLNPNFQINSHQQILE